ncbi:hypothetical protein [Lacticaseibacillus sp. N501-2]|uniref:hypothetical protein n=1 Tax=Lacticaseibacillus salsurae TaxID=3367729 RepID=UPI0038B3BA5E
MENKAQTFQMVRHNLMASYRQFFALEAPKLTMPVAQLQQFTSQSLTRHYRVAVFFKDDSPAIVGHFTRQLDAQRFLLQAYQSNLVRVVSMPQMSFIKRV